VIERGLRTRQHVAWVVRLVLGNNDVIAARAVEATEHELRLAVDDHVGATVIRCGDKCRVEVYVANSEAIFSREAEVQDVGQHGIGLAIMERLPAALVPSCGDVSRGNPGTVSAKRNDRSPAALRTVRSLAAAVYPV